MKIIHFLLICVIFFGCVPHEAQASSSYIYEFKQGIWVYEKKIDSNTLQDVDGVYNYEPSSKCTFPGRAEIPCVMSGFEFHYKNIDTTNKISCRIESDGNMHYGGSLQKSRVEPNVYFYEFSLPNSQGIYKAYQGLTKEDFDKSSSHVVTCFYKEDILFKYKQTFKKNKS